MEKLNNLKSNLTFKYFEEISKIPRESGNEKAISDYFVSFARERNLEVIQDEALNVIIKKPATKGYENIPGVIIQGHMDMVCEKNKDTNHDFKTDPIELRICGDMLYANNTTLGGDDGIAVAYALAILDSDNIQHPRLEVLLTTEEETTMSGALKIDPRNLNGKILINLDSDEEGKLLVSSAGGANTKHILPIEWEEVHDSYLAYSINIGGLKGGHSGIDINKGRGNANKIIGRILYDLSKDFDIYLKEINGGMKSSAIPRESEVVIFVKCKEIDFLTKEIYKWSTIIKNEFKTSDPEVCVEINKSDCKTNKVLSKDTMEKAIISLLLIPNGIITMSMDIKELVESSSSLGVIRTLENEIVFESDVRSSIKSLKYCIINQMEAVASLLNCKFIDDLHYPEWQYNSNSEVLQLFKKVYREKYQLDPQVIAIHAGIECGAFMEKMTYLDIISYGPNVYDIHTPYEHLSISSVERTWDFIISVLKEMINLTN
ncbi:aminoacyl-histidine dipeptidase [Clostridium tagluense]|uniref:aminoacyl-histidine dipeptidase n=1 Tax=Clostridium tagluense TaxID=360422 RepID=UPI001A9B9FFE|nr:aminoacyl-histidine dipeptidase [Clostridium tagluense]